ncbi:hypothetical protein ScPMuIL_016534 [Solemya velum]
MDASFSEAFLVDNDELDLIGSDVEGSSGYGSESDGYASLSDFPMVSTDDLTRPTRECDVMKFSSTDSLCDSLKIIMQMPEMCDVTFLVGKDEVPVHGLRAILGTRSRVFYQLILKHLREQTTNKKSKTSITSTTNLVIPVVKYDVDVFRSLIEFVHCGTAKIEMKTVAGLLCAADQFELDDLRRACWNFVEYCLESGKSGRLKKKAREYNYHEAGQRLISRIYRHYNMEDVRKLKYGQKKETTV